MIDATQLRLGCAAASSSEPSFQKPVENGPANLLFLRDRSGNDFLFEIHQVLECDGTRSADLLPLGKLARALLAKRELLDSDPFA
jgi:hypothetical protein